MNEKKYLLIEKEFKRYYETFTKEDKMILKYRHSQNVAALMEKLAKELNFNIDDIYLAKTIGLLHDIGRFYQLQEYHTFQDNVCDHANYGVKYLFEDNHIRDFIKEGKYDQIIKDAIYNHNKYSIEKRVKGKNLIFSKMIRDMDKIDIYFQSAVHFYQKYSILPSKQVLKEFYNDELVKTTDIKNASDRIVRTAGFINDFNFKESFEILKETDNLEIWLSSIEVADDMQESFNKIKNKCNENVERGIKC